MVKTYFVTFLDLTYDVATTHNRNYANNENWQVHRLEPIDLPADIQDVNSTYVMKI
jgi:hypothetical protein